MKRSTKIEILVVWFVIMVPMCGWIISEIRWARINNPEGKFSNVADYIVHGRQPSRVTKVEKQLKTFFIAFCPMDTWLAVPSGPAAYVFDETGKMIQWSRDTGDDARFQKQWPVPHEKSSIEELKQFEFQQRAEVFFAIGDRFL